MKLAAKKVKNALIVSIEGDLDGRSGPELDQFFKDQMADNKNIIANLSKVEFISSAGLRVFLGTLKEARRKGGDLRVAHVQESVAKVFLISGFTRILKIFPDLDEAVKSFAE